MAFQMTSILCCVAALHACQGRRVRVLQLVMSGQLAFPFAGKLTGRTGDGFSGIVLGRVARQVAGEGRCKITVRIITG